ncbi:MAG: RNA-binding protein [Candidatus Omnitrophota bacterium]
MQGNRLYIGNLKYSVTEGQLQELFSAHGTVKDVTVLEGKGFGFVEMTDSAGATKAKEALDGQDFQGRALRVDEARPPKSREPRSDYGSRY